MMDRCRKCDRPAIQSGESEEEFAIRIFRSPWAENLFEEEDDDEFGVVLVQKTNRFRLDKAGICGVCRMRAIARDRSSLKRKKLEAKGQLSLF